MITDSEDSTPRLRPSKGGSDDLQLDFQDDTLILDSPIVPSFQILRATSKFKSLRLSNIQAYNKQPLIRMAADNGQFSEESSMIHEISPTTDKPSLTSSEHLITTLFKREPALDKPPKIPSSGTQAAYQELSAHNRMMDPCDHEEVDIHQGHRTDEVRYAKGSPTISSADRARSSSHSGRPYVDKKIEATLPDGEPTSNTRSRKASHYLGLFRGNSSAIDVRGDQEKAVTAPRGRGGKGQATGTSSQEVTRTGSDLSGDTTAFRSSSSIIDLKESARGETHDNHSPIAYKRQDHVEEDNCCRPRPSTSNRRLSVDTLLDISNIAYENVSPSAQSTRDADLKAYGRAAQPPRHVIPLRLLEEIRNHHNLTASFHHRFKSSQVNTVQADETTEHRSFPNKELQSRSPPEEYESDKEQISSALYYPHQRPSGTDEDGDVDESLQDEEEHSIESKERSAEGTELDNYEQLSEEVDIALQSQNRRESSYLHGDLQRSRVLTKGSVTMKGPETATSSASESDSESFESDATDDTETTPKATPALHTSLFHSESRNPHTQAAPLGAVELKPYNHQVGGHTTVFRFSKQAVCKQLSNRENEFYEVIERRHPELLRFLPRYVHRI